MTDTDLTMEHLRRIVAVYAAEFPLKYEVEVSEYRDFKLEAPSKWHAWPAEAMPCEP